MTYEYQLPHIAKVTEVAIFLRVSEPTVRDMIREGKLASFRVGRSIRVTRESVEAMQTAAK